MQVNVIYTPLKCYVMHYDTWHCAIINELTFIYKLIIYADNYNKYKYDACC